jgi:hypothetical protein
MITSQQLTTTSITKVFTASTTGAAVGGGVSAQNRAVTNIILCNTGAVTINDESINRTEVDVYLVKSGNTPVVGNQIIANLAVPAGETVFFSDEKIILDGGDEIHVKADDANLITVTVSSLPV